MAVLGYTPQFIEKQYVPTQDIGLLSQILGQKQEQYNKAEQMRAAALADIYGKETTPGFESAAQERIKAFENRLQELTDRKGGDLGAAIGDITSTIGGMYKDPFWKQAKTVAENYKLQRQAQAQNPRLWMLNDLSTLQYSPDLTGDQLMYKAFDPLSVSQVGEQLHGAKAKQIREGAMTKDPLTGMWKTTTTSGATKKEIEAYKRDPEFKATIANSLGIDPYLQNDPELGQKVDSLIDTYIDSLYRGEKTDYKAPIKGTASDGISGGMIMEHSGTSLIPPSVNEYGKGVYKHVGDKLAKQQAKLLGIPGNPTFEQLQEMATTENFTTPEPGQYNTGFPMMEYSSPYQQQAKQALDNIEKARVGGEYGTGVEGYDIKAMGLNSKNINQFKTSMDYFANDRIKSKLRKGDIEIFNNVKKDKIDFNKPFSIEQVLPILNQEGTGLGFYIQATDTKGNPIEVGVKVNDKNTLLENSLLEDLSTVDPNLEPVFKVELEYRDPKKRSALIEDYERQLNDPNVTKEAKLSIMNFFLSKGLITQEDLNQ